MTDGGWTYRLLGPRAHHLLDERREPNECQKLFGCTNGKLPRPVHHFVCGDNTLGVQGIICGIHTKSGVSKDEGNEQKERDRIHEGAAVFIGNMNIVSLMNDM